MEHHSDTVLVLSAVEAHGAETFASVVENNMGALGKIGKDLGLSNGAGIAGRESPSSRSPDEQGGQTAPIALRHRQERSMRKLACCSNRMG